MRVVRLDSELSLIWIDVYTSITSYFSSTKTCLLLCQKTFQEDREKVHVLWLSLDCTYILFYFTLRLIIYFCIAFYYISIWHIHTIKGFSCLFFDSCCMKLNLKTPQVLKWKPVSGSPLLNICYYSLRKQNYLLFNYWLMEQSIDYSITKIAAALIYIAKSIHSSSFACMWTRVASHS